MVGGKLVATYKVQGGSVLAKRQASGEILYQLVVADCTSYSVNESQKYCVKQVGDKCVRYKEMYKGSHCEEWTHTIEKTSVTTPVGGAQTVNPQYAETVEERQYARKKLSEIKRKKLRLAKAL